MKTNKENATARRILLLTLAVLLAGTILNVQAKAQSTPALSIVSPTNGTTVKPNQSIEIDVLATDPGLLESVVIIGGEPFPSTDFQSVAATTAFNLVVPADLRPGRYFFTAIGTLKSGGQIRSAPVSVMIPLPSTPTSWIPNDKTLFFDYSGEEGPLLISAVYGQNERSTINWMFLSFTSDNPAVATVSTIGMVLAQGVGQAHIIVHYNGNAVATVGVSVGGRMRGDFTNDGQVNIDDVNILTSELNTPARGPNDARDLNRDGKIDVLDARIEATLCTHPHCAAQ